jgi:hypothetical protein
MFNYSLMDTLEKELLKFVNKQVSYIGTTMIRALECSTAVMQYKNHIGLTSHTMISGKRDFKLFKP